MSNTKRHATIPRASRIDREGRNRNAIKTSLRNGKWDDEPHTMPTRMVRRPKLTV